MTKQHEHCWHVEESITSGMGLVGFDDVICCHCGRGGRRHWSNVPDPEHGPYSPHTMTQYQPVLTTEAASPARQEPQDG